MQYNCREEGNSSEEIASSCERKKKLLDISTGIWKKQVGQYLND